MKAFKKLEQFQKEIEALEKDMHILIAKCKEEKLKKSL